MLRRLAPRVSAFAPRVSGLAAQRRGMCDGVKIDMVCRVFSCKVHCCQRTAPESDTFHCRPPIHPATHPPTWPPTACGR